MLRTVPTTRRVHRRAGASAALAALAAVLFLAACAGTGATDEVTRAGGQAEILFNGRDLTGWNGDPKFWRVENGTIVGQTTADNPTATNTFLIWDGGTVDDFTLTFDFRLTNGNSGVQYRSEVVDGWVLSGYQGDMDYQNRYTGMLYEEKGRGIVARRGQRVVIRPDGTFDVVGEVGDDDELAAEIDMSDWNTYQITAIGNHLVHRVNGNVTVDVTDDQPEARADSGLIGFQIHTGPPMKIELRDVVLQRRPRAAASR